ncbi:hypothetical protein EVAR_39640_1 [Eumeta japonica]|uniref:Uncharacterized protein n=1 Tax=Eumeta variegata TaxID=151549 RepID=A0A4C1WHR4_EUMVA|nr:hypothetical protein EVAR_39640_1 [Eumeta japonica]
MMRECSVRLTRCAIAGGNDVNAGRRLSAKLHEHHNEALTVIKKEHEDEVTPSPQDLNVEHTREYDFIKEEGDMCDVIKQELYIGATVLQRKIPPAMVYIPEFFS